MLDKKLKRIKILILDVDGVMTDGRIYMNDHGEETKAFNVKDGYGIRSLLYAGIDVAIITGRESGVVGQRAKDLGIKYVYQGVSDKRSAGIGLLQEKGLAGDQACYIGDDLPDVPLLRYVGLPVAVADAVEEVREAALYVTGKNGGDGAVREICELILKSQGAWPSKDAI
ncbi:MAG: HAD hydrolase family protein [Deltaproteobacteria bacterium]|nr:HAD hydrolase family protein [Deltaproteobacteria bacterium]